MRSVYSTDRYFTFPAFQKTALYLRDTIRKLGLRDAHIVEPPADGVTQAGFWIMPLARDVESARLELLADGIPAEQRTLADYEKIPASLGMWSGPTPPGGVEAEVVAISRTELRDPRKLRLAGKLVLMDVNPAGHKRLLVKAGALGAIKSSRKTRRSRMAAVDDAWRQRLGIHETKYAPALVLHLAPTIAVTAECACQGSGPGSQRQ